MEPKLLMPDFLADLLRSKIKSSDLYTMNIIMAIAPNYMDRHGGYTRITPIKRRVGDGALLVKLELV